MASLFNATGIGKSFHLRPVLRDLSFSLTTGEIVFLFGRNGCGKTTLLKILAGIMRPEHGQASLNGLPLFTTDYRWRAEMVHLGHRPSLYPAFTARENLQLGLRLRRATWDEEAFQTLMQRYGLARQENEPVQVYSEGMLQRLGLIRLELSPWRLALLDEPTAALDVDGTTILEETMDRWRARGRTILFTSHDMSWGADRADRALLLTKGHMSAVPATNGQELATKLMGKN